LRTLVLSLAVVLAAVFYFVQVAVNGYDSQFQAPGPLRAWQVQSTGDGEVVTVWGQTFNLPADRVTKQWQQAGLCFRHLVDVREIESHGAATWRELWRYLGPGGPGGGLPSGDTGR